MSLAEEAAGALRDTLAWSRQRGYRGYDKHDALMSPAVSALTINWWPLQIVAVQLVLRSPVNLRPLLGVRTERNPKGLGLFLRANQDRDEMSRISDDLLLLRSPGELEFCWGYQFPWPSPYFQAKAWSPNAIVTTFAAEGLLDAFRVTGHSKYLEAACSASRWLMNLPRLIDTEEHLALGYTAKTSTRVININAVIAGFFARLSVDVESEDRGRLLVTAHRMLNYVSSVQTEEGAWFYTDPARASHIEHDNYHTGGILDGLLDYTSVVPDRALEDTCHRGLEFYARNLFEADGFPRWERRAKFPGDVHGAAQGIITFTRAGDRWKELSDRIVEWSLANLYHPEGRFAYQVGRFHRKDWTLMRWCNAWMCRALAVYTRGR